MKTLHRQIIVITTAVLVACGLATASYASLARPAAAPSVKARAPVQAAVAKPAVQTSGKESRRTVISSAEKSAILNVKKAPLSTWNSQKLSPGLHTMRDGKVFRVPAGSYKGAVTDVVVDTKGRVVAVAVQAIADGKVESEFPIEGAFMEGAIMMKRGGLDRITKVQTKELNTYYHINGTWYNSEGRVVDDNSKIMDEGVTSTSFVSGDAEWNIRTKITGDPYYGTTWEDEAGSGASGYAGGGGGTGEDTEFEMDINYGSSPSGNSDEGGDSGGSSGSGGGAGDAGDDSGDTGGDTGDTSGDNSGDQDDSGDGGSGEDDCIGPDCDDWPPLDDFIGSLVLVSIVTDVTGNSSVSLGTEAGGGPTGPLMRGPAANVWICPDYGPPRPGISKVGSSGVSSFGVGDSQGGGVCPNGGDPAPLLMGNMAPQQQQMMDIPK
jgi:hypothetical protein